MNPTSALIMFFLVICTLFSGASCAPTLQQRDVFSPPVTYPHAGTVWRIGECHNVTWDVSHAPKNITNNIGMIALVKNHRILDLEKPLAQGFDIRMGSHKIVVPNVAPGHGYQILVFGDSGNTGASFTITK